MEALDASLGSVITLFCREGFRTASASLAAGFLSAFARARHNRFAMAGIHRASLAVPALREP